MAVQSFIQVAPTGNGGNNTIYAATLGAGANSGIVNTGKDMIIRICASGDVMVRFGPSGSLTAATATDIYLPGKTPWVVDMGHQNDAISIYSVAGSNVVTVNQVAKN